MKLNLIIDRNSMIPLYAQLALALRDAILTGAIPYGEKLPSENDLVARYGLSRMTVRSALSELVNEKYIEKLHGKGAYVCYRPVTISGNIDVLLDISYAYFTAHYIQSISSVLTQHNYRFIIHDTRDSQLEISDTLTQLLAHGSAGIILQPSNQVSPLLPELRDVFRRISANGIPYIMLDHAYDELPGERMVFDDFGGGRLAAEYLVSLRHERCLMVCCSRAYENSFRKEGFASVLVAHGLPPLVTVEDSPGLENDLLSVIRAQGITGVFCFNDDTALKVIRILQSAGIRVPDDVSVIGFDDTVLASVTNPQLTTVVHPKEILGRLAAEKVVSLIEKYPLQQEDNLIAPRLHVRASCGYVSGQPH
ncbi:MAG: substrate-binding domain-containing protein [Eubacteriales bacterium]|nr:substrate-binding domain-containing protein [Eubacteriales bacterium]